MPMFSDIRFFFSVDWLLSLKLAMNCTLDSKWNKAAGVIAFHSLEQTVVLKRSDCSMLQGCWFKCKSHHITNVDTDSEIYSPCFLLRQRSAL